MAGVPEALARLLAPIDDDVEVCDAGTMWTAPVPAHRAIFGVGPQTSSTTLLASLRSAARRELRLAQLRVRHGAPTRVRTVHRLPPSSPRRPGPIAAMRGFLLAGAAVELGPADRCSPRLVDAILAGAGAVVAGRIRTGSGGGVVVPVVHDGQAGILRAGVAGSSSAPSANADALEALAAAGASLSPRVLDRGMARGIAWSIESRLPGGRPRRLTDDLVQSTIRAIASLPGVAGPPTSFEQDLGSIARAVPAEADRLRLLGDRMAPVLCGLPAVARHGDLWAGNLLVEGRRLTGVVDWDAWHPSAVPGTDALQLIAAERRRRSGGGLGTQVRTWFWEDEAVRSVSEPYWRAIGAQPSREQRRAVAAAWWATEMAGTLGRITARAVDPLWLEANLRSAVIFLTD